MAKTVITRAKVWLGAYDLSGQLNAVAIDPSREMVDVTSLDDETRIRMPGLRQVMAQLEGYFEAGTDKIDDLLYAQLDLSGVPFSVAPEPGAAEGTRGYTFQATTAQYTPLQGAVGEARRFSASAENGAGRLVRGLVMHNATRSGAGNGTAYQLGAVSATQRLYIAQHILAISGGGTLTLAVQSDNAQGMGSPASVISGLAFTAKGSGFAEVAGPITDDWFRPTWTLTGTTPSATFIVVMGIA